MQNWVRLQDECDCVYCVVDLHALTARYDAKELRQASTEMFASLLAAGIDPDRTIVYIQSTVPRTDGAVLDARDAHLAGRPCRA